MAVDPKSEDGLALRKLFPFYTMPAQRFKELCADCDVTDISQGSFLFNIEDQPDAFIYLINGEVSLEGGTLQFDNIKAGTDAAKFALAHQFPRKVSARAVDLVSIIHLELNAFDKSEIDYNEQKNVYRVESNEDATDDWLATLLQTPLFRNLPAVNLQQVLRSLDNISFNKGQTIFKLGDAAEYCYLIRKGTCVLSHEATDQTKKISYQEIPEGELFGEHAVLTGELRNKTATALTDMLVSRMEASRFIKFIKDPAVNYVDYQDLDQQRKENPPPLLIDLRTAEDYQANHIEGFRNIPFLSVRQYIPELINEPGKIIWVCNDGSTSDVAAIELFKQGRSSYVLARGMRSLPNNTADKLVNEIKTMPLGSARQIASTAVAEEGSDLSLQLENQHLNAENKRLQSEIDVFKKQYRLLYKQTQKLKAALDRLQAK